MKCVFSIKVAELIDAVRWVCKTKYVPSWCGRGDGRSSVKVHAVQMQVSKGQLTVTGQNHRSYTVATATAECLPVVEGEFAVEAKEITGLLKAFAPEGMVSIRAKDNGDLEMESLDTKIEMAQERFEKNQQPIPSAESFQKVAELDPLDVKRISKMVYSEEFSGVKEVYRDFLFIKEPKSIRVVKQDGTLYKSYTIQKELEGSIETNTKEAQGAKASEVQYFNFSQDVLNNMAKLIEAKRSKGPVELYISDEWAKASWNHGEREIVTKRQQMEFKDYHKEIANREGYSSSVDRERLCNIISGQLPIISGQLPSHTILQAKDGQLLVEVKGKAGVINTALQISDEGNVEKKEDFLVKVNSWLLYEALRVVKSKEVLLHNNGERRPLIITRSTDDKWVGAVMPIRMSPERK